MTASSNDHSDLATQIAVFRYGLISDVVRLKPGARGIYEHLRHKAAQEHDIPSSPRTRVAFETLRSWVTFYRKSGLDGLMPKPRSDKGRARKLSPKIVDAILETKEQSPKLTVKQVIAKVLSGDDVPAGCILPTSTVHRLLDRAGLMVKDADTATNKDRRQFSYKWAGELVMSDVMHGPALLNEGRRKRKTYLIAFIDDATRVITHGQFCWSENTATFFPVFKKSLQRRGIPQRLYVDNGAAYRSRQLELVCAKLGTTLIHARPYQPQGKGKIERFFRTVRMNFLNQAHADSIEEMNQRFWAWVEGEYHDTPHRGIDNQTPFDRWAQVGGRAQVVGPRIDLDDLFLWEQKRKVRTDRTVSLDGNFYEVPAELVRQTVILRYDPDTLPSRPLQVWHGGKRHADATPLDKHANCFVKRDNKNTADYNEALNFTNLTNTKEQ